jgi:hypothetical protein
MKALLLLVAIGIVGYFVYRDYFAGPEPLAAEPSATPAPKSPTPTPVPFAIKSAVRSLYEEWKRRELGDQQPAMPEPQKLLTEIRRNLFNRGEHTEAAVNGVIVQALAEMDLPPGEREHVAVGIMSMR